MKTETIELPIRTGPSVNRHRSKQDYETPQEFIEAVEKRFGPINIDLAASPENAKARMFFTEQRDSLLIAWHLSTGNLWLNPPFSNISPWAEKCMEESRLGAKILFLVPASVDSNWWDAYVHHIARVLFLNPRIKFDGQEPNPKTGKIDGYPKPLALCCYGVTLPDWYAPWRWK